MIHQTNFDTDSKMDKAMSPEQFNQIVDAILDGKYSWACVLILRFAGYNPLHYIPYRTYNRLIKDNAQKNKSRKQGQERGDRSKEELKERSSQKISQKIRDLNYLEEIERKQIKIHGGARILWW